jgi:hypothetical protein
MMRHIFTGAAIAVLATSLSFAQQQTVRVVGTITGVDGPSIVVKSGDGNEVKVNLADKLLVIAQEKGLAADIKTGDYVGVGGMPQPDGTIRAVQISIMTESQRGSNEGHGPWSRDPKGTMTNATVAERVTGVDGPVLTVKYKDGEKKVLIPADVAVIRYTQVEKGELKSGAQIAIGSAVKKPDGTLEAARVNVGRGGYVPN